MSYHRSQVMSVDIIAKNLIQTQYTWMRAYTYIHTYIHTIKTNPITCDAWILSNTTHVSFSSKHPHSTSNAMTEEQVIFG